MGDFNMQYVFQPLADATNLFREGPLKNATRIIGDAAETAANVSSGVVGDAWEGATEWFTSQVRGPPPPTIEERREELHERIEGSKIFRRYPVEYVDSQYSDLSQLQGMRFMLQASTQIAGCDNKNWYGKIPITAFVLYVVHRVSIDSWEEEVDAPLTGISISTQFLHGCNVADMVSCKFNSTPLQWVALVEGMDELTINSLMTWLQPKASFTIPIASYKLNFFTGIIYRLILNYFLG